MENKMKLALGGVELLIGIGVSALVGGAIAIVKPNKLGLIKKVSVGLAGFAISAMAVDGVTNYVHTEITDFVDELKGVFNNNETEEETVEEEVAE